MRRADILIIYISLVDHGLDPLASRFQFTSTRRINLYPVSLHFTSYIKCGATRAFFCGYQSDLSHILQKPRFVADFLFVVSIHGQSS